MRITIMILSLILYFYSFHAVANAIYLSCEEASGKEDENFEVTIDRNTNTATHTTPKTSWKEEAFFRAHTITYGRKVDLAIILLYKQITIDRRSLTFTKTFGEKDDANPSVWKGQCQIIDRDDALI